MSAVLTLRAGWEMGHRVHSVDPGPVPILQMVPSAQLSRLTPTAARGQHHWAQAGATLFNTTDPKPVPWGVSGTRPVCPK